MKLKSKKIFWQAYEQKTDNDSFDIDFGNRRGIGSDGAIDIFEPSACDISTCYDAIVWYRRGMYSIADVA